MNVEKDSTLHHTLMITENLEHMFAARLINEIFNEKELVQF